PLCSCAPGNPSVDFLGKREWRGLAPYVTRAAISPIQPVSYLEPVGQEEEMAGKCRVCRKTENLMRCGRCKKVEYCSGACQKVDWKEHKVGCK
ncbi:hypothetical protein C7212DRAFT_109027, partial [Tuber magnatum]